MISTTVIPQFFSARIQESWTKKNTLFWMLLIAGIYGLSMILKQTLILTSDVMWNTYADKVSAEFYNDFFSNTSSLTWVNWVSIALYPIKALLVSAIVAGILYARGLWLSYKLKFIDYWKVSFAGELILVLGGLINMLVIFLFVDVQTIEDFDAFHEFSLKFIAPTKTFLAAYPFRLINLFEIAYVFLLCWGIGKQKGMDLKKGVKLVFSSYIPMILLWAVLVGIIGSGVL